MHCNYKKTNFFLVSLLMIALNIEKFEWIKEHL